MRVSLVLVDDNYEIKMKNNVLSGGEKGRNEESLQKLFFIKFIDCDQPTKHNKAKLSTWILELY